MVKVETTPVCKRNVINLNEEGLAGLREAVKNKVIADVYLPVSPVSPVSHVDLGEVNLGSEKLKVILTGVKVRVEGEEKRVEMKFLVGGKEKKLVYPYKSIHNVLDGKIGKDKLKMLFKDHVEDVSKVNVDGIRSKLKQVLSFGEEKESLDSTLDSILESYNLKDLPVGSFPIVFQDRYVLEVGVYDKRKKKLNLAEAIVSRVLIVYKDSKGSLRYAVGAKVEATDGYVVEFFANELSKRLFSFGKVRVIDDMPTTLDKLVRGERIEWLKINGRITDEAESIFGKYVNFRKLRVKEVEVERKYVIGGETLEDVVDNIKKLRETLEKSKEFSVAGIKLKHKVDTYYKTPKIDINNKKAETNFRIRFSGDGWEENYKKRIVTLKLKEIGKKKGGFRREIEGGEEKFGEMREYLPDLKLKKLPKNLSEVPDKIGSYEKLGTIDKYMVVLPVTYKVEHNRKEYVIKGKLEVSFLVIPEKKALIPVVEYEVENIFRKVKGSYYVKLVNDKNNKEFNEVGEKALDKIGKVISEYATKVKWKNKDKLEEVIKSKEEDLATGIEMYGAFLKEKRKMAEVTYWTKKK